jgi:hypothetical protein
VPPAFEEENKCKKIYTNKKLNNFDILSEIAYAVIC